MKNVNYNDELKKAIENYYDAQYPDSVTAVSILKAYDDIDYIFAYVHIAIQTEEKCLSSCKTVHYWKRGKLSIHENDF